MALTDESGANAPAPTRAPVRPARLRGRIPRQRRPHDLAVDHTTTEFLGIPIERTNLDAAVERFLAHAVDKNEPARAYRLVNAYTIALAHKDDAYLRLLRDGGVDLPDGKPLSVVLHRLDPLADTGQVRGPSFFTAVLERGRARGTRHFFLGGTPEILDELTRRATTMYPGLVVAGAYSPPFRALTPAERAQQDDAIRDAAPDVVWVSLGTPKQDHEAQRIAEEVGVVTAGVGAAFNFFVGHTKEAPVWMRDLGLEWLFRLAMEPRRLWKRYVFGNARFVFIAAHELLLRRR